VRIDAISIDGFGVWHDWRLVPDPGLTVVCGDNEAGKTTLLAFVRAMLFGFEPNQYPAVGGGRRGGWLEVTTADGRRFRIARYHDRGGQGTLQVVDEDGRDRGPEYLGRLLHGVEASVYRNVFAFRLDELAEPKGLTEGGAAARIYGAGLGTGAASALAVESALRTEASALFRPGGSNPRINQLLREIEEVERELATLDLPADYSAARARLDELENERGRLDREADALGAERRRLERIDAAWQPVQDLAAASERLAREPDVASGLDGAIERHGRLEAAVHAAGEAHEGLVRRAGRAREQLAELTPDEDLLAARGRAERLIEERAAVRAEARALEEARQQHASAARDLAHTLAELGEGWTEDRLATVDTTVASRAALAGRFRDLLDASARDLDHGRAELVAADAAVASVREELAALDRRASVGAMPDHVAPRRRGPVELAAVTTVSAAAVGVALLLAGATPAALVALAVGAGAAVAMALARPRTSHGARAAAIAERREILVEQLERATRTQAVARERVEAASRASARARDEWQRWCAYRGYDPALDRETTLSVLDAVAAARATARRRDEAAATVARLEERRARYVADAHDVLATLGRATPDSAIDAAVESLAAELVAAAAAMTTRDRLKRELTELDAEARLAAERRDRAAEALGAFLEECCVQSEAELREAVAARERRRALEEAGARARQALAMLAGHGEAIDQLVGDVRAVGDIAEVRDRLAATRAEAARLAESRDGVLQEIGALHDRLRALEASAEGSAVRQRHADLVARLEAEAEHWTVRRLAVALMERTRQRYEREHRPRVIRVAEEYLSEWTDGRWVRVVAPLGAAIEGLERADGRHVPIGSLSRGTQEQLYLALRFGLIEHFADEAEPLPIVMDETLVNFDDARAERTARTIERLAERHQILYFTCRNSTPLQSSAVVRLQPPTLAGAVGADRPPAVERVPA
jgi:uncharacterized protein YhaN